MRQAKPKKRVITSSAKAANSPSPNGGSCAPCGHSHCDSDSCRVRYIGATSPMHHHHILHAARGVTHMWIAVIIAGLAVVLTGAVAYASANAENQKMDDYRSSQSTAAILDRLEIMEKRMDTMEKDIEGMFRANANIAAQPSIVTPDEVFPNPPQN